MILMPPGSAKSTYTSLLFPVWWFLRHPRSTVICASHSLGLARSFGRRARDLVQDIYLKLTGPFPTDIGNPGAYLYRLGTNLMLDQIKQRGRTGRRETAWRELNTRAAGGEDVSEIPAADEALAARQQLAQIIAAVETVAPAAREAFRLHKLQGLSHQETATAMGISRSSVEKHIMTCLKVISAKVAR